MELTVRPISAGDHDPWAVRFAQYREFYRLAPDADVVERVWGWILDDGHETSALAALADLAAREGRGVVRWITAADNAIAQRLYDDVATRTTWVMYDLASGPLASRR